MTYREWAASHHCSLWGYPFNALIMSAMTRAHGRQLEPLVHLYPDIYRELMERNTSPRGVLDSDNPRRV